jgi:hypothetical protein
MRGRFILAMIFGLVSASAFGGAVTFGAARADHSSIQGASPQGVVTFTPTVTLTSIPSASASPTFTPQGGSGGGGSPGATVPTLSAGMLTLLALGLATVAVLLIRRT